MTNTELLLHTYGYWALVIGTALEGEAILVLGGFAAHSGYLNISFVILSAFIGTLIGDQTFFWLGRKKGNAFLCKRPGLMRKTEKARRLLERYRMLILLSFRFLYGFRTITPILLGTTKISFLRFFILNAIGAFAWACVVAGLGYFFGAAMTLLLGDIRRYEVAIAIVVLVSGFLLWMFLCLRSRRCAAVNDVAVAEELLSDAIAEKQQNSYAEQGQ